MKVPSKSVEWFDVELKILMLKASIVKIVIDKIKKILF